MGRKAACRYEARTPHARDFPVRSKLVDMGCPVLRLSVVRKAPPGTGLGAGVGVVVWLRASSRIPLTQLLQVGTGRGNLARSVPQTTRPWSCAG